MYQLCVHLPTSFCIVLPLLKELFFTSLPSIALDCAGTEKMRSPNRYSTRRCVWSVGSCGAALQWGFESLLTKWHDSVIFSLKRMRNETLLSSSQASVSDFPQALQSVLSLQLSLAERSRSLSKVLNYMVSLLLETLKRHSKDSAWRSEALLEDVSVLCGLCEGKGNIWNTEQVS